MDAFEVPKKVNRHVLQALHAVAEGDWRRDVSVEAIEEEALFSMRNLVPVPNVRDAIRRSLANLSRVGAIQMREPNVYRISDAFRCVDLKDENDSADDSEEEEELSSDSEDQESSPSSSTTEGKDLSYEEITERRRQAVLRAGRALGITESDEEENETEMPSSVCGFSNSVSSLKEKGNSSDPSVDQGFTTEEPPSVYSFPNSDYSFKQKGTSSDPSVDPSFKTEASTSFNSFSNSDYSLKQKGTSSDPSVDQGFTTETCASTIYSNSDYSLKQKGTSSDPSVSQGFTTEDPASVYNFSSSDISVKKKASKNPPVKQQTPSNFPSAKIRQKRQNHIKKSKATGTALEREAQEYYREYENQLECDGRNYPWCNSVATQVTSKFLGRTGTCRSMATLLVPQFPIETAFPSSNCKAICGPADTNVIMSNDTEKPTGKVKAKGKKPDQDKKTKDRNE